MNQVFSVPTAAIAESVLDICDTYLNLKSEKTKAIFIRDSRLKQIPGLVDLLKSINADQLHYWQSHKKQLQQEAENIGNR